MNIGKYFFSCMFLALFAIACGPSSKPSSGTAQFVEPDPGGVASPVDIRGEVDTIDRQRYVYDMGNSEGVIIANIGDEVDRPLLIYDKGHKLWLKTSFEGEYSENLMKLVFDHCKSIRNHEYVKQLSNLKILGYNDCGELDTIDFIKEMPTLEDFRFVNTTILDGNLSPCLALKYAGFNKKKHYSHKPEQMKELIRKANP